MKCIERIDWFPLCAGLLLVLFANQRGAAQAAMVSIIPDADSFVRSLAPASNYGGAGALSVSGVVAVNGAGVNNGLFGSLMRFPMSNTVTFLDNALGGQDWVVTSAKLFLTEMATPDNEIFNRGVGAFEIRWLASDGWIEGTGKPSMPTTDGVTWQDLPLIVDPNLDRSLGMFTNSGANGQISFALSLEENFISEMHQGGELALYLIARSDEIGFTFNSRHFGNTNAQPLLVVMAEANPRPRIDSIALAGTNVAISFRTVSNWTYRLQGATVLSSPPGDWSNLLTIPSSLTTNFMFLDSQTNGGRLYRLLLSP